MAAKTTKRFHPVNPAMIAHTVPFAGCEWSVFWVLFGVSFAPAVGTGFQNIKMDLISVGFFLPSWGAARLLYLRDPRSFRKFVDHLSWAYERYVPRRMVGTTSARSKPSRVKKLVSVITRLVKP